MNIAKKLSELDHLKRLKNFREAAIVANELGNHYKNSADYEESLKFHKEDLELCRLLEDPDQLAQAYRNISEVQVNQGNYEGAKRTIKTCLALVVKTGDEINEERCYKMLVYTYINQFNAKVIDPALDTEGLLGKARKYIEKCFLFYSKPRFRVLKSELNQMKGRAYTNLSVILCIRGHVDESLLKLKKAEDLFLMYKAELREDLFTLYNSIASYIISADIKRYSKTAVKLADKAIKVIQRKDNKYVDANLTKAKILILDEQFREAKEVLLEPRDHKRTDKSLITALKVLYCIIDEKKKLLRSGHSSHKSQEIIGDAIGILTTSDDFPISAWEQPAFSRLNIRYYQKSLEELKKTEHTRKDVNSLNSSIAQCLKEARQLDQALKKYNQVFDEEEGSPLDQCSTISQIVSIMEEKKMEISEISSKYEKWFELAVDAGNLQQKVFALQESERFFKENAMVSQSRSKRLELDRLLDLNGITEDDIANSVASQSSDPDWFADIEINRHDKRNTKISKFKPDDKGEYLLHKLVRKDGQDDAITATINEGHLLDVQDNAGWTPLGDAMEKGVLSYVRIIVNAGADINRRQCKPEEDTPLILAARECYLDVVEFLLEAGADPTLKNTDGITPLSLLRGHKEDENKKGAREFNQKIDKVIRLFEAKYRSLGETIDKAVAPDTAYRTKSLVEDSGFGGEKNVTTGLQALRLKRREKAAKAPGATRNPAAATRNNIASDLDTTLQNSSDSDEQPPKRRSNIRSSSSDSDDNRRTPINTNRSRFVSDDAMSSDDEVLGTLTMRHGAQQSSGAPKPRRVVTSTQISGMDESLPVISCLSQIQPNQNRRKFPGPSQSLPDITSPPSPVFISKKSLYENKSRKSTSPEFKANGLRKNSSPEFKANESQKRGDDVYRDAMEQVRHRQFPTIQNTPVRRDSSGDDDFVLPDLDEWLEDDLGMIKEKRKRERSSDEKKTDKQKRPRVSLVGSHVLDPPPPPDFSSRGAGGSRWGSRSRDIPSPTPIIVDDFSPIIQTSKLSRKKSSHQPKIKEMFGRMRSPVLNSIENTRPAVAASQWGSTSVEQRLSDRVPDLHPDTQQSQTCSRMIKVRIEGLLMRIPIKARDLTVGWLCREAGMRYEKTEGNFPVVKLQTEDGAHLDVDDLLKDAVEGPETLVGSVVSWITRPPHEKYKEHCSSSQPPRPFFKNISKAIELAELTNILTITLPLKPAVSYPLSRSLKCWSSLRELRLSGCKLGANIDDLKSVLSTLSSLSILDLSNNGLVASMLDSLSPLPPNLSALNVSHNFFGNHVLKHLSPLLGSCSSLASLSLAHCGFSQTIFQAGRTEFTSAITRLKELNVSGNILGPVGLEILLNCCPMSLESLDASSTLTDSQRGNLRGLVSYCRRGQPDTNLQTLKLGNCHLSDDSLPDLLECIKHLGRLKTLDLSSNSVSGVMMLGALDAFNETDTQITNLVLNNCVTITKKGWEDFASGVSSCMVWHTRLELLSFPDLNPILSSRMLGIWTKAWGSAAKHVTDQSNNIGFSV